MRRGRGDPGGDCCVLQIVKLIFKNEKGSEKKSVDGSQGATTKSRGGGSTGMRYLEVNPSLLLETAQNCIRVHTAASVNF